MRNALIGISVIALIWIYSCTGNDVNKNSNSDKVKIYYLAQITHTLTQVSKLINAVEKKQSKKTIQQLFLDSRLAFKKTEFLASYYTPLSYTSINGAPIPVMDEDDQHRVIMPEGFQVIEPFIFSSEPIKGNTKLLQELHLLKSNLNHLQKMADSQELADAQIFDALRLELFRVISLGISGYDAPIAQNSVLEAKSVLNSVSEVLAFYHTSLPKENNYMLLQNLVKSAEAYLMAHPHFNNFNRMDFITQFANPISREILRASQLLKIKPIVGNRALKADTETMFKRDAFNADYYVPNSEANTNPAKVELGAQLFSDPILSGNGKRACISCHKPEKAFSDGLDKSPTIDGLSKVRRNTPTLLNAGLQASLFYDNRVSYLEDQATEVISNADEMHGSLDKALISIQKNKEYVAKFREAFKNSKPAVTSYNLRNAIGSYVRSLSSLNSRFDKYINGDKSQMNAVEINGFNLFMGKAKCGTCHFTPLFNGTVPPDFIKSEMEVIGIPKQVGKFPIDTDKGRYLLRKIELQKYAFKTPTVRNIELTAPYMHNGAFKTLQQVLDFYNEGGVSSIKENLENQTLPFDSLNLTPQEKQDIIAFMNTLTDNTAGEKYLSNKKSRK